MGIFATNRAIKRIESRQGELLESIHDLKRAVRSLELEYTELYDKVRHQMSRMAKRAAVDAKENGDATLVDAIPNDDEVDPISAKILARRGFLRRQAD